MAFDLSKVLAALESGVKFAEQIAPTIAELTPYGAVASTAVNAIGAVADTVSNIAERVNEGKIVATSNDQAQIRDFAQRLHDVNDGLADLVAKS